MRQKNDQNKRKRFFENTENFQRGLADHETIAGSHYLEGECSNGSNPVQNSSKNSFFQESQHLNRVEENKSACQGTLEEDSSEDVDVDRVILDLLWTIFGQTSYQRSHEGRIVYYNDAGDDAYTCSHCTALFWSAEALKRKKNHLIYTHCCEKGKVQLPMLYPISLFLEELLNLDNGRKVYYFVIKLEFIIHCLLLLIWKLKLSIA